MEKLPRFWAVGLCSICLALVSGQSPTIDETNASEADYYRLSYIYNQGSLDDAPLVSNAPQQAPFGYRPGKATRTNSCQSVRRVPSSLRSARVMKPRGLASFYQKYTEAYGIPVLSSNRVPDDALRRACYTLRFLLAGNSAVRNAFYRLSGRVAVIGKNEGTNWIPEHSNLPAWWNQRARGLGATPHGPVSSGGEENVLCYQTDRYRAQDIFLHESAHGVHLLGAAYGISGWDRRLRNLYNDAKRRGRWARTYSMSTPEEYFAEGTQSYFNVNSYAPQPDGVRGPISTRSKLRGYDPQLYRMIEEVFPCDNNYLKRCDSTRAMEDAQELLMDCDVNGGGGRTTAGPRPTVTGGPRPTTRRPPASTTSGTGESCRDSHRHCGYWAGQGQCNRNPGYMRVNCKKSCSLCNNECQDKNDNCQYWARTGECDRNPAYMNTNCASSCEQC